MADVLYTLMETIEDVADAELEQAMNNDETSNCVVMTLRFITSAWIRSHPKDYEPFLDMPLDRFCAVSIECFGSEADHVTLNALSQVLNVKCNIHYMDGHHSSNSTYIVGSQASLTEIDLLYTVGHYELLCS